VCGAKLNDDNWHASRRKRGDYICKGCRREQDKQRRRSKPEASRQWRQANPGYRSKPEASRQWRQANPEKSKASYTKSKRDQGVRPFNENKECSQFLGVYVAERVLSYVFKDVERMPMNNPGFDFVCNHGKMIDVKSACLSGTKYPCWHFRIRRNTTADYFLCLAFDNREELTPLHVWLIPGSKLSYLTATSISPSTIHKWDTYRLDISKINDCCVTMRKHVR
jgi:hypothetical protein